jgi:hypothetical protein
VFGIWLQPNEVDDVDHPHRQIGQFVARRMSAAASVSSVGTSPAQARTPSGSDVELLAHSQIPSPRVQCAMASSMVR